MAKIVTLTLNPATDKSTSIQALQPEKKLRCSNPHFEPGGGGINVARAIRKLGGHAIAVYPAGGYSGRFFTELLEREGVPVQPVETKTHTRENLIVFDRSTNQQYRFGMPGSGLELAELKELLSVIQNSGADYIIASGSIPPGVPTDIFSDIAAIAKKMNAKLVVDTSGDALKKAVHSGVYLLKPNLGELSSLVGLEDIQHDMVIDVAREIIGRDCCQVIVVSLGAAGAVLITKDEYYHVVPPVVKRLSTVGAGDSMVAGLVFQLSQGINLREALAYGVACGTAATMNPGTELCRKEDVEKLFEIIKRENRIKTG
jgi:6-phosphofructokinase 2